jgi:hypothetical protein
MEALAPGPVAGWESAPPPQRGLRAAPCPYTPPATSMAAKIRVSEVFRKNKKRVCYHPR